MQRCLLAVPIIAMTTLASCESAPSTASNAACEQDRIGIMDRLIEPGRILEDSAAFARVHDKMSLHVLLEVLGPASRDIGSGLYILIWEARDGSTLRVRASSLCEPVMSFERSGP
jgi:hypothetical protein